jgi:ADP-ribose pyrophosphatase YjhB (NUDIX family)
MGCDNCGFRYFFNPTIGLAGFIENHKGEILLIERGKDPAKGKLAPPGGFADIDESAEKALSREVFEEVGLHIGNWNYLTSAVNYYTYADVTYPVLDFFYTSKTSSPADLNPCPQETISAKWIPRNSIDPASLAFPSMQEAMRQFLAET